MPTIKKLKRRGRQSWRARQRHELYGLPAWRELSKFMRHTHPICAVCELAGEVTPSEHVHHISSPFRPGLTEEEKIALLLNPTNLVSLCPTCHSLIHAGKLAIPPEMLDDILSGRYYDEWREKIDGKVEKKPPAGPS